MILEKTINGEKFKFYGGLDVKEKTFKIRGLLTEDWIDCEVSKDFNYLILSKPLEIKGKMVEKLKLNSHNKFVVQYDYEKMFEDDDYEGENDEE